MFVNRMWQDEVQRIGKQRCTTLGYQLHGLSDLIGLVATILFLALPCYLVYRVAQGTFAWPSLWMLLVPFAVAIVGSILHSYSWHLADIREFKYDYETRISSWRNDTGDIETFTYDDFRKQQTNV